MVFDEFRFRIGAKKKEKKERKRKEKKRGKTWRRGRGPCPGDRPCCRAGRRGRSAAAVRRRPAAAIRSSAPPRSAPLGRPAVRTGTTGRPGRAPAVAKNAFKKKPVLSSSTSSRSSEMKWLERFRVTIWQGFRTG